MAATITWLGTGNFEAPGGRYWNGFVVQSPHQVTHAADGLLTLLVELAPSTLPNLRRAEIPPESVDVVALSHFHPDHSFGWPFFVFSVLKSGRTRPITVIGPPGVAGFLEQMMRLGSLDGIHDRAHRELDIVYLEAEEGVEVDAAGLAVTPVRVDHVPELECFGYVFGLDGHRLGYSGDTTPCPGLEHLAEMSETLVLECNGTHRAQSHMDVGSVRALAERFPDRTFIVTHRGADVVPDLLPGIAVPQDFDRMDLGS
jgi:ribonuclease Z